MSFLLKLIHRLLMALIELLPSPLPSSDEEDDDQTSPPTENTPEGDDPLTFADIRRELSLTESDELLLRPSAKQKVQHFRNHLTKCLKKTLPEVTEITKYLELLQEIRSELLNIKNVVLSDIRRFRNQRRSPSEYYQTVMRSHIHSQLIPYLDVITAEIGLNEQCHGVTDSTKNWISEKFRSLIMALYAMENIEVGYFD